MKIRFGDCTLDTDSRQLWRSGSTVHLSPKAFDLLKLLVERRPGAISKSELHERIWPGTFVSDDSLSRLIVEVREATGDNARRSRFVRTLHGFGYAFSAGAETIADHDDSGPAGALERDEEKTVDIDRKTLDMPIASRRTWPRRVVGASFLGIVLVGALVASRSGWKSHADSRTVSFVVLPPEGTALSSSASLVAISPNGRYLAFLAVSNNGRRSLWVRPLESIVARELPGTEDALAPFWSPNSDAIGFFINGKCKKIALESGLPEAITEVNVRESFSATWNRQGSILYGGENSSLFLVSATGGTPRAVTHLDKANGEVSHYLPSFLPDGRHFTFLRRAASAGTGEIWLGSLDSPELVPLVSADSQALYAEPGYLFFLREGALFAQRFDAKRLRLSGAASRIIERVGFNPSGPRGMFTASDAGVLAYRPPQESAFIWFDRTGTPLQTFPTTTDDRNPALSPDGTRLAVDRFDRSTRTRSIWILELERGVWSRFTSGRWDMAAVWSPDGTRVAFRSDRAGGQAIVEKAASGGPDERVLVETPLSAPVDWADAGRAIFYTQPSSARTAIAVLRLVANAKSERVSGAPFNERTPRLSPNGRWLAYSSDETGRVEVYVTSFPGRERKWRVSSAGGVEPVWRRDGKEFFYIAANQELMAASVDTGDSFRIVGTPAALFQTRAESSGQLGIVGRNQYVASPDGQRFVVRQVPPGSPPPPPITVVLNWVALMAR